MPTGGNRPSLIFALFVSRSSPSQRNYAKSRVPFAVAPRHGRGVRPGPQRSMAGDAGAPEARRRLRVLYLPARSAAVPLYASREFRGDLGEDRGRSDQHSLAAGHGALFCSARSAASRRTLSHVARSLLLALASSRTGPAAGGETAATVSCPLAPPPLLQVRVPVSVSRNHEPGST